MGVIYEHKQSKARRTFGGRIARLDRSDEWELVEDNEPQPLVVNVAGSDEPGVVRTADDADVPGTDPDDVDVVDDPIVDGDQGAAELEADGDAGDPADEPFPQYKGGGNYELSDGTTVKGKAAAQAAQSELDS